jgi:hypothetical protein
MNEIQAAIQARKETLEAVNRTMQGPFDYEAFKTAMDADSAASSSLYELLRARFKELKAKEQLS